MSKNSTKIRTLVYLAMLTALNVIFSRITMISFNENIKLSFEVVAIAFAAYKFGIGGAVVVAGLGDAIGALARPIASGAYNPVFTITAILTGLIFALIIHKRLSVGRIILAVLITQVFCSQLLNTFFIAFFYSSGATLWQSFVATFSFRLIQFSIMTPVEMIVLIIMIPIFKKMGKLMKTI